VEQNKNQIFEQDHLRGMNRSLIQSDQNNKKYLPDQVMGSPRTKSALGFRANNNWGAFNFSSSTRLPYLTHFKFSLHTSSKIASGPTNSPLQFLSQSKKKGISSGSQKHLQDGSHWPGLNVLLTNHCNAELSLAWSDHVLTSQPITMVHIGLPTCIMCPFLGTKRVRQWN
jgi:hypothetical protein